MISIKAQQTPKSLPTPVAFLSIGLRPFFLLGALWAASVMAIWIVVLAGGFDLPTRFDPVSWHAHAILFGYLSAIVAGFLLTAVPNWTGRAPVNGKPLLALVLLWCAGRVAVALSDLLPLVPVILIDLSFPVVLGTLILREVIAGKNWRNLIVVVMLAAFTMANMVFHLEAARGEYAAQGIGIRLGLASALMMISVIGGRVIPAFTSNWFKKTGKDHLPTRPMQGFDKAVLLVTLVGLLAWVFWSENTFTGCALVLLAALHTGRLIRWKGIHTRTEPLVWVLHASYAFIPIGAAALGTSILWPELIGVATAQHIWMAGAIGLMTLSMMTRATLGHTGRDLHAGITTVAIYISLIGSMVARLSAGAWPEFAMISYTVSGTLWICAFGGFAALYGPLLLQPSAGEP